MKKVITIIFITIMMFSLVGCKDSSDDNKNHIHSFEEWETTKNPTCTDEGTKVRYCSCGEMQTQNIPALGHTEVIDEAKEPTCTKTGLTQGKHCSTCGEILLAQNTISAIGHDWGNPTCTTPRSCCVCFEVDPNSKPLGHNFVDKECRICGDIDILLKQMAALGIDTAYNSSKFPATLHLSSITYHDMVNGYGDPITRMVMRFYASNSLGGYGDIYVTVVCCEYETEYQDYEWGGLYFSTYVSESSPGDCDISLDNESAMEAYKDLINNPKDIPFD